MQELGAIILYSEPIDSIVSFYRAVGIDLEERRWEAESTPFYESTVGGVYFAIYPAQSAGAATPRWTSGSTQLCLLVQSLEQAISCACAASGDILVSAENQPWGRRAVLMDPEGRPVEWIETAEQERAADAR
ncbi:hypothetical protein HYR99_30470 [Candidatus Poribacteria bacterium]|nr:hypothetical protein [Candidatus Poribacteria bacterium]